MPTAPYLVSLTLTQPTAQVPTGTLVLVANAGDSIGPLTVQIPGVTSGVVSMSAVAGGHEYRYTQSGVAPGTFRAQVYDASPAQLPGFQTEFFTVNEPPKMSGCTDPDADNYDPTATEDDGSCAFSQRLSLLYDLPELAPLGVPLLVTLTSQGIVAPPAAPATCLLDLAGLAGAAGVQVRVAGYLFTSGPLVVPGRFTDAATLLVAMQQLPALAAAYVFTSPAADQVRLTSRTPGVPGTPAVSTSDPTRVALTLTPGVAGLWSERRYAWGCYVEVWAGCGARYGGPTDKATAVLAQRLTLPYQADNAYGFDVASALRQFTAHDAPLPDGSCPDRLVSYFLRFGEEYADVATGLRRVRSVYESGVAWGIEAMELPPLVASGLRLLSTRPWPWRVRRGDLVPLLLLALPSANRRVLLRYRLATSRTTANDVLDHEVATGQVTQAGNRLLAPAGVLSAELLDSDSQAEEGEVLAALDFSATGPALQFVNRLGGLETVYWPGSQDENQKRTASTFTGPAGPVNLSAELTLTQRLYSGLLDYPTWDWLRRELAVSPAAWLVTPAGPVPVLVADVQAADDAVKGEYSISVDYQPAPVRGLSN